MGAGTRPRIAWAPQPGPQAAFVTCPVFEVVYGGARGGGKTDSVLGDWALHAQRYGKAAKGLLVRRSLAALGPTIERAKEIFGPLGADWKEGKSEFWMPGGGILRCRYLDRDADADKYQGHDYTRVYVEELTQFPSSKPVDKLKATLRSAAGVPCGFRATCNPGGPGHTWVKDRHINPGAWQIVREEFENPFDQTKVMLSRVFIPARLSDNPRLLENDPGYVGRLYLSGSAALVKAWLEGDWDSIEGAFFDKWSGRNIVRPFAVPELWTRIRSLDWGYAAPFSVGWWAIASDAVEAESNVGPIVIPRGAMIRYREWYGCTGKPNEGVRLEAEAVGKGILERERGEKMQNAVADPSIFNNSGGPTIGERLRVAGAWFRPADNTRIAAQGALSGWDQMRARIVGQGDGPMLYVFDTCRDFIRTVPVLQHDPNRAEDLDTSAEDHIADEARYACLSRPMTAGPPAKPRNPKDLWGRQPPAGPVNWKVA